MKNAELVNELVLCAALSGAEDVRTQELKSQVLARMGHETETVQQDSGPYGGDGSNDAP